MSAKYPLCLTLLGWESYIIIVFNVYDDLLRGATVLHLMRTHGAVRGAPRSQWRCKHLNPALAKARAPWARHSEALLTPQHT